MKNLRNRVAGAVLCTIAIGAGIGLSTVGGAASNSSAPSAAAERAADTNCQALAAGLHNPNDSSASFSVVGAYASTAGQVASWEAQRDGTGTGLMSSAPPAEVVTVCFITGQLQSPAATSGGPSSTTQFGPGNGSYGALVGIVLSDGSWVPDVLIHGSSVPYSAPPTTSAVPVAHQTVS
jgi:hypothetical protein